MVKYGSASGVLVTVDDVAFIPKQCRFCVLSTRRPNLCFPQVYSQFARWFISFCKMTQVFVVVYYRTH